MSRKKPITAASWHSTPQGKTAITMTSAWYFRETRGHIHTTSIHPLQEHPPLLLTMEDLKVLLMEDLKILQQLLWSLLRQESMQTELTWGSPGGSGTPEDLWHWIMK